MMILLIILGYIVGYILCGILAVGALAKIEDMTIDEVCDDGDNAKVAIAGVLLMPLTALILFAILFGKIFILCLKHVYKISQDKEEKTARKKAKEQKKEEKEKKKEKIAEAKEKKRIAETDKVTRFDLVDLSE